MTKHQIMEALYRRFKEEVDELNEIRDQLREIANLMLERQERIIDVYGLDPDEAMPRKRVAGRDNQLVGSNGRKAG